MKKKRQLSLLKALREIQCQNAQRRLLKNQSKLQQEEQRLRQLESYQHKYGWREGRQVNGLMLCNTHMMANTVDKVIRHQYQQVAIQESQYRSSQSNYIEEKLQLRTAEALLDSHQQVLNNSERKKEQKQLDEISSRAWYTLNHS